MNVVCLFYLGFGHFGYFDYPDFAAKAPLQSNIVNKEAGVFTINIISLGCHNGLKNVLKGRL